MTRAEDNSSVGTGVILPINVHHGPHHLGEVGGSGGPVRILEHLDTRLEVGDDNSGVGADLQSEDVSILSSEGEEALQEIVREMMNGSEDGKVGWSWRKAGWQPLSEVFEKNKNNDN